jgi:hypothetical protein
MSGRAFRFVASTADRWRQSVVARATFRWDPLLTGLFPGSSRSPERALGDRRVAGRFMINRYCFFWGDALERGLAQLPAGPSDPSPQISAMPSERRR